jgi:glucose-1-phosphate adenylyltransferase
MKNLHGLILAYSSNTQLKELTEHRTVSSIPFGCRYRVIDFMLSNMVNAGITDVGVVMRENYQSLLDHLGSGKDWDLARKRGGLRLLPPFGIPESPQSGGFFRGKMEALASVSSYLSFIRQDYICLADGDIVVNLPLESIYDHHIRTGADITCVCTPHQVSEPEGAAYIFLDGNDMVKDVLLGRAENNCYESLGVYIMSKRFLENVTAYCRSHNLYSFERDVLQNMLSQIKCSAFPFEGYAARMQSTAQYFRHSINLLSPEVRSSLFMRSRPIKTKVRDETSAYYGPGSDVSNSLLADGCIVEGTVENSVLFRGVKVERGAVIKNSILLQDTRVLSDAQLNYVIADKRVVINAGRILMGHESYPIAVSKGVVI